MTDTDPLKEMVFLPCKHPIQEEFIKTIKEIEQVRWCLHCGTMYQPRQVHAYYFSDLMPLETGSVEELAAKDLAMRMKKLNSQIIEQNKALKEDVANLETVARINNIEYNTKLMEYEAYKAHHQETVGHLSVFSKKNTELTNKQSELLNVLKTTRKTKNAEIAKLESHVSQLKGQLKKVNIALESERTQSKSLNKKITELQSEIASIQKDDKAKERMKQDITQLNSRNELTNATLKNKENKLAETLIANKKLEQTITELTKRIEEQKNTFTTNIANIQEELNKSKEIEKSQKEEYIKASNSLYHQLCDAQMYIQQMQWYFYGPPQGHGPHGPHGPPQISPTRPNNH